MDIARWGLKKDTLPTHIVSSGGRFGYKDDGETPNTQVAAFRYDDVMLEFEVRGLPTNDEHGVRVGNIFYGPKGYLVINGDRWQSFLVDGRKESEGPGGSGDGDHFGNFIQAVQERKPETLNAEILEGHLSSALCHLANVSYRLGRAVTFDPKTETFGNDQAANALLTREYRSPFTMPESV
jgi:hypothetical protein